MKTLRSYVCGDWYEATEDFVTLVDPSTEEEVAQASSTGVDFEAVVRHANEKGGPALRSMLFEERAALLKAMSKTLRTHRDELLDLSRQNNGTTVPDGSFDIDGATGTLAYYAGLGKMTGRRVVLPEGDGVQLAKTEAFWTQQVTGPRRGVAVAVNAFNFPVWGFAEKAACALLAGMPMIVKPATSTALAAERAIQVLIEADILPEGALQMVCGRTGNLLDLLGPQDVFAFTGSADTARALRQRDSFMRTNTRVNVEADSLNAAVLGPDVEEGSTTWKLFIKDVAREIHQKTGQKCTAVRRVIVPAERQEAVIAALSARLDRVVTGNPAEEGVTMGPLANASQLRDAEEGVAALLAEAQLVYGTGKRVDGVGSPEGKGYFFAPALLVANEGAGLVHEREVFAPVATLLTYQGAAPDAGELVARGGGTLVTSVYTDDFNWLGELIPIVGAYTGRLYLGSAESSEAAPGSGVAMPQSLHGGPGRAGGGEELGGMTGVKLYMQRIAVQGSRAWVERLTGTGGG